MSAHWIGIDLGTCNSSAAIKTKSGEIHIVRSAEEKSRSTISATDVGERCKEFPSFISFKKDGSIDTVGMRAKDKIYSEPEFVVWGIKRLIGKSYSQLKKDGELERFTYRIRPDSNNGKCLIVVGEKSYTPEQLCAEICKKIKRDAEAQEKTKLDSVVVSVPAYFDPTRVTPIIEAARLAGFDYIKTIPEPVAAAMACRFDITVKPMNVLVFDLGAGTLDVTTGYLYRSPDQTGECPFQVVKNTGDPRLGGVDMDDRLAKLIQEKCQLPHDTQLDKATLRRMAEIAKIRLSSEQQIEKIEFNGKEYPCTLTQFDLRLALEGHGMERNLLEACRLQINAAIDESGWFPREVEILIIIGGPTRLPCIRDVLKTVFNTNPMILQQIEKFYSGKEQIDRMTAVSMGAAMSVGRRVDDVVPYGHGFEDIEFSEKEMTYIPNILIPRDSTYPFRSPPHRIRWRPQKGPFIFKIIQHIPESEIGQFGFQYKFIGSLELAVRDSESSIVVVQMGYNVNREIEVVIADAASNECVSYVGIGQSASLGMNYPLTMPIPNHVQPPPPPVPPDPRDVADFFEWVKSSPITFIRRKLDSFPVPQLRISQIIDEIRQLLERGDPIKVYNTVYNQVNGLINDSRSRGLLSQEEHDELKRRHTEFQARLFRFS
jgi:molecular chaperone DnaK (HSP70)